MPADEQLFEKTPDIGAFLKNPYLYKI